MTVGDGRGKPADYPFRVFLRTPEATTIPIFALGVEAERAPVEWKLMASRPETFDPCRQWQPVSVSPGPLGTAGSEREAEDGVRRTAIYSSWVALADRTAAEALVNDHPGLGLAGIEKTSWKRSSGARRETEIGLSQGAVRPRPLDYRTGMWRARAYLTEAEALDKLEWSEWPLPASERALRTQTVSRSADMPEGGQRR